MACTEQHQVRNSITGAVSPPGGEEVLTHTQAVRLGLNENQLAVFNRSFALGAFSSLAYVVPALMGSSLLASDSTVNQVSTGMPDNQWQFECEHWFGVAVNTIQLWSQQYISGPLQPSLNRYVVPATEGFAKEMCTNQIAVRADYRSFSVLGMLVIFIFGLLTIIAFLIVEPMTETVQKRTSTGRYRNAEWRANDVLQLQRMAYQHNDTGTWVCHNDLVPRTHPGETFTLPESTQWNHTEPEPEQLSTKTDGLFRSWSGRWSGYSKDSKPPVTDSRTSDLDSKAPVIESKPVFVTDSSNTSVYDKSATTTARVEEIIEKFKSETNV